MERFFIGKECPIRAFPLGDKCNTWELGPDHMVALGFRETEKRTPCGRYLMEVEKTLYLPAQGRMRVEFDDRTKSATVMMHLSNVRRRD